VGPTPAPKPVKRTDPFRGLSTLPAARFASILEGYPLGAEAQAIWTAVGGDPLPVAQSWRESRYGQDDSAKMTHNPLGLLWYPGSPISRFLDVNAGSGVNIKLLVFPNWAAAFAEWKRRMTDPNYKGGVYMPVDMPLEQMIYTYVGGPGCWSSAGQTCGNGETGASVESYLQDTIARLDRYYGVAVGPTAVTAPTGPAPGWTPWSVAGSAAKLWLPSDIRFRIVLTPRGPNRSGAALNWTGTTRHETGNERPGTNADMHSKWQDAGTPGHPDGKIGVHFYSDDREIIQKIPVDEQGVHSGDWRNHQHTGCERCVNSDGNSNASERIASYLDAGLLRILNTTALENLYPHHNTPGSCPVHINTHWKQYETTVDQRIREHGR